MITKVLVVLGFLMASQLDAGNSAEMAQQEVVDEKYTELLVETLVENDIYHEVHGKFIWVKNSDIEKIDALSMAIEQEQVPSERTVDIHAYYMEVFESKLKADGIKYKKVEWYGAEHVVLDDKKDFENARILKFEVISEVGSIPLEELKQKELPIFR